MATELEIAEAIASGELLSPQPVGGSWLIAMRISGTGCAFRPSLNEYAWRDGSIWLNARMAQRWRGAPVVLTHPDGLTLSAGAYQNSVLGAIAFSYIQGDELWCIARTYSNTLAAELIQPEGLVQFDTSPGVVFRDEDTQPIELIGGQTLLIEGEPELVDHLAVIVTSSGSPAGGVWTKGSDDPADLGIPQNMESTMETADG
jgi:hypothetical protein